MRKTIRTIIAMTMLCVMMAISPMTDLSQSLSGSANGNADISGGSVAKAATVAKAAGSQGKYISEIRLGMGYTDDDAQNSLTMEGFTLVKKSDGYPVDVNSGAWDPDSEEYRGKSTCVYLGYKTTDDPKDAITDLAVMNMEGGYSVEEYEKLIKENMETKIRPFLNRFLSTLNEYRENLKKPQDSENYKRADYMRNLLNTITDDDTGDSPIGDLLINETKFEMGDAAYDRLSDSEKKKHADILTMFVQGDDAMISLMCNLLARGADTSEDSWIDRFQQATLQDLSDEVQSGSKSANTKSAVNAALDKKYEDAAKSLLKNWDKLAESMNDIEGAEDVIADFDEEEIKEDTEQLENLDENNATVEEVAELTEDIEEKFTSCVEVQDACVTTSVAEYLENIEYDFKVGRETGSTLLDFFRLSKSDFSGDNIRELYPIVDALSDGQIAGLDYLSIKDMIFTAMGINNDDDSPLKDGESISFYNAVNRELYDKDGVALTSDALRKQAAQKDVNQEKEGESVSHTVKLAGMIIAGAGILIGAVTIGYMSAMKYMASMSSGTGAVAYTASKALKVISYVGVGLAIAGTFLQLFSFFYLRDKEMEEKYNIELKKIPKYMVDEADIVQYNEKGEREILKNQTAYYKVAFCNRRDLGFNDEFMKKAYNTLGDHGDLNGDIGAQWVALYAVKLEGGDPILADSLLGVKDSKTIPSDYTKGIHEFGNASAFNMNKSPFVYSKDAPKIFVYYKTEKLSVDTSLQAGTTGSIISDSEGKSGSGITAGGIAIGGGIGIVLGTLLGMLIMYFSRRKKVAVVEADEQDQ